MNPTDLFISMLAGSFGVGFFIYGKKQQRPIPLVIGIALVAYPYFMPNRTLLILVGLVLLAIPTALAFRR